MTIIKSIITIIIFIITIIILFKIEIVNLINKSLKALFRAFLGLSFLKPNLNYC